MAERKCLHQPHLDAVSASKVLSEPRGEFLPVQGAQKGFTKETMPELVSKERFAR